MSGPIIMVHGGAGNVSDSSLPSHREGCLEAARAGGRVLQEGGSAVDAACAAVEVLEDNPRFNAGTGCALDLGGRVSLDAAVMCGATRDAGAVAALPSFKNPVRIAQRLLGEPTLMLAGHSAAAWAEEHGFSPVPPESMIPERTLQVWRETVARGQAANWAGGTVGAVARDAHGRLAAATSTGGTMGKLPGRVGDTPVIGCGFFADEHCAACATGQGEAFLRGVFSARVAWEVAGGAEPAAALKQHLEQLTRDFGGYGGAILLAREGEPHAAKTTPTMSHAWWSPSGEGCGH